MTAQTVRALGATTVIVVGTRQEPSISPRRSVPPTSSTRLRTIPSRKYAGLPGAGAPTW